MTEDEISWEERSRYFGASLQGVLFKNLPEVLNEHIHNWHLYVIDKFIQSKQPKTLLDVGCGYGRISGALMKKFPSLQTVGLDISTHYIEFYHRRLNRPAYVASIENLPDDLGQFDCILVVTVLMYLDKEKLHENLSQLWSHLKEDGSLIIIEPHCSGRIFQNPFGIKTLFCKKQQQVNTGGDCFKNGEIDRLIQKVGGKLTKQLRMPMTTVCIIPLYVLAKVLPEKIYFVILKFFFYLDKYLGRLLLPSLHSAYLVNKIKL